MEDALSLYVDDKECTVCLEDDVRSIAAEIMTYLHQRPMAADTLDGIAYWWLIQQTITKNVALVERALEHLVREGKVVKNENKHRGAIYFLNDTSKVSKGE